MTDATRRVLRVCVRSLFSGPALPWLILPLLFAANPQADAAEFMIATDVDGQRFEGRPLFWSQDRVQLMLRDGRLFEFPTTSATNFSKTADHFKSYSAAEVRSRLAAELGQDFEITSTGHYLVAHPKGQRDRWARRFEDLHRQFVHYFTVRGFEVEEPSFPLIAIVWKNQDEYRRHAVRTGTAVGKNVLGYYSPKTNRVHLYDEADDKMSRKAWQRNASTIIHEVTHQTAFNTGVHRRFTGCPRWVAEGLGLMFEAPGVYDSARHPLPQDRINRAQLANFRRVASQQAKAELVEMIASDQRFRNNVRLAYAQSWAFSYYLAETQPRRYTEYLARTSRRKPGTIYSSTERLSDFTAVFGDNFDMHQSRFEQFMRDLP